MVSSRRCTAHYQCVLTPPLTPPSTAAASRVHQAHKRSDKASATLATIIGFFLGTSYVMSEGVRALASESCPAPMSYFGSGTD